MFKKHLFSLMAILAMAVFTISIISCSKDDESSNGGGSSSGTGGGATSSLVGTWRKYSTDSQGNVTDQLGQVLWEFLANGTMYEHDIDDDGNIIEGKTETFKYKTENGHLKTDKLKSDGYRNEWKDEGAYVINGDILEITKDSGTTKRYKKIK